MRLLQDLHKDAQDGAFEVEIKGAIEVTMELYMEMHLVDVHGGALGSAQERTK